MEQPACCPKRHSQSKILFCPPAILAKPKTLMCIGEVELSAVPLTPKWRQFYFLPAVSPDRGPFLFRGQFCSRL